MAMLALSAVAAASATATPQTRFLLLDRRVVERDCSCNANVTLVLGQATKDRANPLVCEDRPWEVTWLNTDPDVWYDNGVWHFFYLSLLSCSSGAKPGACPTKNYKFPYVPSKTFNGAALHPAAMAMLYANSSDGIAFVKPSVNLFEFNGSSANNIISANVGGVLLDEAERNASRKWKMIGTVPIPGAGNDGYTLDVWFSADCLHWSAAFDSDASRAILGNRKGGDTHNNLYRIGNDRFGAVTRLDNFSSSNLRRVGLSTTVDFQDWRPAEEVLLGAPGNQTYGMQVTPWVGADLYVGSLAVYDEGHGKVYNELAVSYDGLVWERLIPGSVFVPHGAPSSFDSYTIYSAKPVRDPADGSIRMYYSGGNGPHSGARADCLGLAHFHSDGFAGWRAEAGATQGVVQTRPLNFTSTALEGLQVNAAVGTGGSLIVEAIDVQDGSLIVSSESIKTSIADGVGKTNVVWSSSFPHWKSRQACVLRFVMAGNTTVFSFVPGKATV
eukprot:COSAG02_NODE_1294_length_13401_cov_32.784393_9_plen_499_part_00